MSIFGTPSPCWLSSAKHIGWEWPGFSATNMDGRPIVWSSVSDCENDRQRQDFPTKLEQLSLNRGIRSVLLRQFLDTALGAVAQDVLAEPPAVPEEGFAGIGVDLNDREFVARFVNRSESFCENHSHAFAWIRPRRPVVAQEPMKVLRRCVSVPRLMSGEIHDR